MKTSDHQNIYWNTTVLPRIVYYVSFKIELSSKAWTLHKKFENIIGSIPHKINEKILRLIGRLSKNIIQILYCFLKDLLKICSNPKFQNFRA
jgi:hypothetical protein